ncbi:MAG: ABC transporter permease [Lachnospiraceae bacterium]|nr:ABC transporter permease [Lachnospiraceae bacterium]
MSLITALLAGAIMYAVSVLYAGIGETFTERAGIMNLGIEGIMLMGAVTGCLTALKTQSLALSMLAVMLVGAVFGLVFAFLTVTLQSDQTVCGMAILVFGSALSGYLGKNIASTPINLKFQAVKIPLLGDIPFIGEIFFNQNILVYIMYIILPLSVFYIYKTRWGLKLRALGENPAVLDAAGENVFAMRYAYIIFGTVMMAISGAFVSLAHTNVWQDEMTAGKGWIAFALVAFAAWNPAKLALGALLFGFISNLGSNLQIYLPQIPSEIYAMMPYLVTIIVFIVSTGSFRNKRTDQPAMLAKPYNREDR